MANGVSEKGRVVILDELRGLAVVCMVVYHALFTVGSLFGYAPAVRLFNFFMPAQPFFASLFIFISGICSRLSHSNLKRGFKLLFVALAITGVTVFLLPMISITGCEIYFGILSLLSVSILIFAVLDKAFSKFPAVLGLLIFLSLFVLTYHVIYGYIGVGSARFYIPGAFTLPDWLMFLGLPNNIYSADYFPLIPWMFMFMAGTFFGVWVKQGRLPKFCYKSCIVPLQWPGRHALIIYILHQPLIYGIALAMQALLSAVK